MDNAAWERAKDVLDRAMNVDRSERTAVLDAGCGSDTQLRARVEALLAAHDKAGGFLANVTLPHADETSDPSDEEDPRDRFSELQDAVAGRYSLERELGRGGMGLVYLARDVALDRAVAIKLLATRVGRLGTARERFLREARISAGLSHPNIAPVHAVEEHGDLVFFVMGFVEGRTIRERVRRSGPMPVGEVTEMLQQVAGALGHAHGQGVVHRDVKPDNVILERASGRAIITDFGIARMDELPGFTSSGALIGTPEYASPEQAVGENVDGRSDLYSLGLTAFFALTGRLPFEGRSSLHMLMKRLDGPASPVTDFRRDMPDKLTRAIDRCLARNPEDRFATAEELAAFVAAARST